MTAALNGHKKCSTCKEYLPVSDYGKNKTQSDGYQNACNDCRHGYWNRWYKTQTEDPAFVEKMNDTCRKQQFKQKLKKYGLTQEEYDVLSAKGCGICGGPPLYQTRFAFDHDHKTGKFRGLLCSDCNTALGLMKDSPDILFKSIMYLTKSKEEPLQN